MSKVTRPEGTHPLGKRLLMIQGLSFLVIICPSQWEMIIFVEFPIEAKEAGLLPISHIK